MTRTPKERAASALAPVAPPRVSPQAGGNTPHPALPPTQAPGEAITSPPSVSLAPGGTAGTPDPGTGEADPAAASRLPASPGRGRTPRSPAGGLGASPAPPAGLQGAEWRKAVEAARSGNRRKTTRTTGKRPAQTAGLPPVSGAVPLIATATCGGCEWTAGPGSMADVDRASDRHVARGHSTAVSAELGGAA